MVGVRKDEKTSHRQYPNIVAEWISQAAALPSVYHLNHVQAISVQTCPPRYVLCSTQLKYILNMYSGESAVGKSR